MDLLLIALLPAILFIGIITSYEDLKYGKIRNRWILFGLFYFLIIHFLLVLFYWGFGELNLKYIILLGTNLFFSVLTGFGLWFFKIWSAGDGKLFIVYSSLIPLTTYSSIFQKWFPSLDLLVNVFVLAFLFLFINLLWNTSFSSFKKVSFFSIKEFFKIKQLFFGIITLFAILWIVEVFLSFFNSDSFILKIGIIMVFFLIVPKKYLERVIYFSSILVFLRCIFDNSIYSTNFLKEFLFLFLVWFLIVGFLRSFINNMGQEIFNKEIKIQELIPGMVLSKSITKVEKGEINELKKQKQEFVKYRGRYYTQKSKSFLISEPFIEEDPEGLTLKQIKLIKSMGFKRIKISRTVPFAFFMFIGTLLTLLVKGNFLSFLKGIF